MTYRERIGVHDDDARRPVLAEVGAVGFQAAAILQKDGFRRLRQKPEPHAFEDGQILRFGEYLHIRETPFRGHRNQPGNERDGKAHGTGGLRYGQAFDEVTPKAATGEDGSFRGKDRQIQINFPEPETIAPEEVFHLAAE